jgi:hypothetical protein
MGASKQQFIDDRYTTNNGYDGIDDDYFYSQQQN